VACTQVDFYLLGAADPRARLTTACRIAEKACDQGLRVAVRTASPSETPVLIASGALPVSHRDVLINLATDTPADATHFGRICEVVGGDEDAKQRARLRWRGYREAGLSPASHDV